MGPELNQLDLVVKDMEATLAFYRALGMDIPEDSVWRTASGAHHVDIELPTGFFLHFDSEDLARVYDQGWKPPAGPDSTRNVVSFRVDSRDEVDRIHDKLTGLGHPSSQPPYDTFWGARYAIVVDPDGNHIGLMSPSDPDRRRPPPDL